MANIVPIPKNADKWTEEELVAYNVKVRQEDFSTFFELPELPDPSHTVKPSILTTPTSAGAADLDTLQFLRAMERAIDEGPLEPSAVVDFAVILLEAMHYDQMPYILCRWKNLEFIMSGEIVKAEIDVSLVEPTSTVENIHLILLAVRPDQDDAEPQLVASAIAAFRRTNIIRKELGLPRLEERTFAGVIMEGTQPTFYKVPITRKLVKAVEGGGDGKGLMETVVKRYTPEMPDGIGDEIRGLENRRWWLGCFEAFKNSAFEGLRDGRQWIFSFLLSKPRL